jgi:cytoskeletal protein RodZ
VNNWKRFLLETLLIVSAVALTLAILLFLQAATQSAWEVRLPSVGSSGQEQGSCVPRDVPSPNTSDSRPAQAHAWSAFAAKR